MRDSVSKTKMYSTRRIICEVDLWPPASTHLLRSLLRAKDKLGLHLLCPRDRPGGEEGRSPRSIQDREVLTLACRESRAFREQLKRKKIKKRNEKKKKRQSVVAQACNLSGGRQISEST